MLGNIHKQNKLYGGIILNVQEEMKIISILEYLRNEDRYNHEELEGLTQKSYEYFVNNSEKCKEDILKVFSVNYYNHYYLETVCIMHSDMHIKDNRKSLNEHYRDKVAGTCWYRTVLHDMKLRMNIKATLGEAFPIDKQFLDNFIKSRSIFFKMFNPKTIVSETAKPEDKLSVRSGKAPDLTLDELYEEIGNLAGIHYNALQTLEMFLLSRGHVKAVPTDIIKQLAFEVDTMGNQDSIEDLSIDKLKELKTSLQIEFNELMEVQ